MSSARDHAMQQAGGRDSLFLERIVECAYSFDGKRFKKAIRRRSPRGHITHYGRAGSVIQRTLDSVDLSTMQGIEGESREDEGVGVVSEDERAYVGTMRLLMESIEASPLLFRMSAGITLTIVRKSRLHIGRRDREDEDVQTSSHHYVVLTANVLPDSGHSAACASRTVDPSCARLGTFVEELERKTAAPVLTKPERRIDEGAILYLPSDLAAQVLYACVGCLLRRPRRHASSTLWPKGLAVLDDPRSPLGYYQHAFDEVGKRSLPYSLIDERGDQVLLVSDIVNGANIYGTMRLLDGRNVMESAPSNVALKLREQAEEQAVMSQCEYAAISLRQLVFESLSSSGRIAFDVTASPLGTSGHKSVAHCRISGTPEAVLGRFVYIGEPVGHYPGDYSMAGAGSYLRLAE